MQHSIKQKGRIKRGKKKVSRLEGFAKRPQSLGLSAKKQMDRQRQVEIDTRRSAPRLHLQILSYNHLEGRCRSLLAQPCCRDTGNALLAKASRN